MGRHRGSGSWWSRFVLIGGLWLVVVACIGGPFDSDDISAAPPGAEMDRPAQELYDRLRDRAAVNISARLDFEVGEWCEFRTLLDELLPPPGGVWDSNDPLRQQQVDEVWFLIDLLEEQRTITRASVMPEAFATRLCVRCPWLDEELPAGSPRLPPGTPGVWAPDCTLPGADDPMGELGCGALMDPSECEAAEACWFRYLEPVGCHDMPDLVAWTNEWCAVRRESAAWTAEKESHVTHEARQAWLAANQQVWDAIWERILEIDNRHDGFEPGGFYTQPLKCEMCPDVYNDC